MCRHLAYLGPPRRAPTNCCSTRRTRSASRRARPSTRRSGETNPDGWGVGWYRERRRRRPSRYRTVTPIWDDARVRRRSRRPSRAARSSAPPASRRRAPRIDPSGNAPFVSGPWLFSLNGAVGGFRKGVDDQLRARAEPGAPRRHRRRLRLRGAVRAHARPARRRRRAGRRARRASSTTSPRLTKGRLNMLLTDGHAARGHARTATPVRARADRRRRNRSTTMPTGARSPTTRSSSPRPSPTARRPRSRRCSAPSPMTSEIRVDVHLEPDAMVRALEADVRAGLVGHTEDAPAEVVLRRPRQRALRRDHAPARVLPDARGAEHPRRTRRRRSPRAPAPTRSSSSARARRRRRGCCSTRSPTRARSVASCPST